MAQDILATGETQRDLSGNPILIDSGVWLKTQIKKHFKDADIKYIDPSYLIRSIPTTSGDRIYCKARPSSCSFKESDIIHLPLLLFQRHRLWAQVV